MGIHRSVRITLSVLGFIFAFFLCLLLLPAPQQASSQAQNPRQPNDPTPDRQTPERKRKDSYAHRIPPEFQVKLKNLQNDDWAKDLEIEIKIVSNKPIYFFHIYLHLPEVRIGG